MEIKTQQLDHAIFWLKNTIEIYKIDKTFSYIFDIVNDENEGVYNHVNWYARETSIQLRLQLLLLNKSNLLDYPALIYMENSAPILQYGRNTINLNDLTEGGDFLFYVAKEIGVCDFIYRQKNFRERLKYYAEMKLTKD
jgi:hypothetical protein